MLIIWSGLSHSRTGQHQRRWHGLVDLALPEVKPPSPPSLCERESPPNTPFTLIITTRGTRPPTFPFFISHSHSHPPFSLVSVSHALLTLITCFLSSLSRTSSQQFSIMAHCYPISSRSLLHIPPFFLILLPFPLVLLFTFLVFLVRI